MFAATLVVALGLPALVQPVVQGAPAEGTPTVRPAALVDVLPADAAVAGALDLTKLRESPALRRLLAIVQAPGGVMPDDLVGRPGPPPSNPFTDPTTEALAFFLTAERAGEPKAAPGDDRPGDDRPGDDRPVMGGPVMGGPVMGGPVVLVRRSGPVPPWPLTAPPGVEERRRVLPDGRTAASRDRSAPAAALAQLGDGAGGPPPGGPAAALRAEQPNVAALGWFDVAAVRAALVRDLDLSPGQDDEAVVALGLIRPLLTNVNRAAIAVRLVPPSTSRSAFRPAPSSLPVFTRTPAGEFDAVVTVRAACRSAEAAVTVRDTLRATVVLARNAAESVPAAQHTRNPAGGSFTELLVAPLRRALATVAVEVEDETVTATLTMDADGLTLYATLAPPAE